jgi:16S rRNA (guanine966-N2)-methyltransferase
LGERVVDARVLDLYAGSGSIGLEALSRGAADVVFVESDRDAFAALARNVEMVGLGGSTVRADVEAFLRSDSARYDLAFVDPPYGLPLASVQDVLGLTARRLDEGATLVLHRRAGEGEPLGENLRCRDRRRYGDAEIWVYAKEET